MLFKLAGKVMLDTKDANRNLDNLEGNVKKKEGRIGKAFAGMAKGAALLGTAMGAVGAAGIAAAGKFSKQADEIDKTSMKLGIGTDAYQELGYAMGQVGVDQGSFERSLGRLNQRMTDVTGEGNKYRDTLHNLGIATEDVNGKTRSADEVFMDTMHSLHEVEDASKRSALAAEIFGTSTARQLMPAIEAGGEEIDKMRGEAHELGAVMSGESVDAGVKYADTMDQVRNMLNGVFVEIMMQVLPAFQNFLDWVMDHMPEIQAVIEVVVNAIGDIMGFLIGVIGDVIDWMRNWYNDNQETLTAIKEAFFEVISAIKGFIFNILIPAIQDIIAWVKEWFDDNSEILESLKDSFFGFAESVKELISSLIDFLMWIWENWGEDIMEYLGIVFKNVQDIFQGALDIISGILDTFSALFRGDWRGMLNGVRDIVSSVMGLISNVFRNMMDGIKVIVRTPLNWISDRFEGALNGIRTAATRMRTHVQNMFRRLRDGIKAPINGMIGFFNGIIGGFERIINAMGNAIDRIPSVSIPSWVPGIGGNSYSVPSPPKISLPQVPALAAGGNITGAGTALVGERGAEVVDLPRGASVRPLRGQGAVDAMGGYGTANITVELDGRTLAQVLGEKLVDEIRMKTGAR